VGTAVLDQPPCASRSKAFMAARSIWLVILLCEPADGVVGMKNVRRKPTSTLSSALALLQDQLATCPPAESFDRPSVWLPPTRLCPAQTASCWANGTLRLPALTAPMYWELPTNGNDDYRLEPGEDDCRLHMKSMAENATSESGFIGGVCPSVLSTASARPIQWKQKTSKWGGKQTSACSFDGFNPSFVVLPLDSPLRKVASAEYLVSVSSVPLWTTDGQTNGAPAAAASNTSFDAQRTASCPLEPSTMIGLYSASFEPLLVAPLLREHAPTPVAKARNPVDDHVPAEEALSGSSVRVSQSSMMDVALLEHNGHFVVSAQDYSAAGQLLTKHALIAPLRVELVQPSPSCEPRLLVTTHESLERVVVSCGGSCVDPLKMPNSAPHKNPSLFMEGDELMMLDLIAPTKVGRLATLPSTRQRSTSPSTFWSDWPEGCTTASRRALGGVLSLEYPRLRAVCFNASNVTLPAALLRRLDSQHSETTDQGAALLHSGRGLVRMPELGGELLGVGHVARGYGLTHGPTAAMVEYPYNANHYTHFLFTIRGSPPYELMRLSSEFCFGARDRSNDCESVQFASTLQRVRGLDTQGADELLMGYGTLDAYATATRLSIAEVLSRLQYTAKMRVPLDLVTDMGRGIPEDEGKLSSTSWLWKKASLIFAVCFSTKLCFPAA